MNIANKAGAELALGVCECVSVRKREGERQSQRKTERERKQQRD